MIPLKNREKIDILVKIRVKILFSDSESELNEAVYRLKFDEHFFLQMLMALRKS